MERQNGIRLRQTVLRNVTQVKAYRVKCRSLS